MNWGLVNGNLGLLKFDGDFDYKVIILFML